MRTILRTVALWMGALGLAIGPMAPAQATAVTDHPEETASSSVAAQASKRLAGKDRYSTAVAISQHLYPAGAGTVFVANGTDFPDALAGGPGAAHLDGPVLLINSASNVPSVVKTELDRLNPDRIMVLGGSSVVGSAAVSTLQAYAPVTRLGGQNRYETAAAVAGLWNSSDTVYIASGQSYPDALAGGAAAGYEGAPVLLSTSTSLSQATSARLASLDPARVIVLGGKMVTPTSVVNKIKDTVPGVPVYRFAGENRYATAQAVADNIWPAGSSDAFYATGLGFADALSGIPAAAQHGAPLLLVQSDCAPNPTRKATSDLGVSTEYLLGGKLAVSDDATTTACGSTPPPPATDTVLAVLEDIPVKGRAPRTGYDRDEFGAAWTDDVDVQGGHNGCDTRNDVLRRDLDNLTVRSGTNGCVAQTGWLNEPFTGDKVWFERGETSQGIHIDHLVALSDAWQKGAQQLTFAQRKNFANDPLNLWAVDGGLNMQKGDGDAATWLPPNKAIRCDYVAYQTAVKDKYGLWITQAEKDAIANVVTTSCPNKKIPTANNVPPLG